MSPCGTEYQCKECGHSFDRLVKDSEEVRCPRCGSDELERNPFLLGSCSVDELTEEDYFAAAMEL